MIVRKIAMLHLVFRNFSAGHPLPASTFVRLVVVSWHCSKFKLINAFYKVYRSFLFNGSLIYVQFYYVFTKTSCSNFIWVIERDDVFCLTDVKRVKCFEHFAFVSERINRNYGCCTNDILRFLFKNDGYALKKSLHD